MREKFEATYDDLSEILFDESDPCERDQIEESVFDEIEKEVNGGIQNTESR